MYSWQYNTKFLVVNHMFFLQLLDMKGRKETNYILAEKIGKYRDFLPLMLDTGPSILAIYRYKKWNASNLVHFYLIIVLITNEL